MCHVSLCVVRVRSMYDYIYPYHGPYVFYSVCVRLARGAITLQHSPAAPLDPSIMVLVLFISQRPHLFEGIPDIQPSTKKKRSARKKASKASWRWSLSIWVFLWTSDPKRLRSFQDPTSEFIFIFSNVGPFRFQSFSPNLSPCQEESVWLFVRFWLEFCSDKWLQVYVDGAPDNPKPGWVCCFCWQFNTSLSQNNPGIAKRGTMFYSCFMHFAQTKNSTSGMMEW